MATFRYDVLIIGSGAAGLTVALGLPAGVQAALLSKGELTHASTYYAQGGVAAVLDSDDSLESHVRDTHLAGGGLCHDDAVRYTCLLYTSPSPRDQRGSRMPSSA